MHVASGLVMHPKGNSKISSKMQGLCYGHPMGPTPKLTSEMFKRGGGGGEF